MTPTPHHRRTRVAAGLVLTLMLAGTTACGDDEDTDARAATAAAKPAGDAISGAPVVTAVDYAFEDVPTEVEAGTAFELRNRSAAEVHELVAMQLPDGERRTAADLVKLPEQEMGALVGGPPALVLLAPPGDEGVAAVGDGTLTEPGRYLLVCFIPTGAEPAAYVNALEENPGQPPSVPGGAPHFTAGMFAELTVR